MIKRKKLPYYFWGEAATTAAYVLNRCPAKRVHLQVLKEVWYGRKPFIKHLRVFGSLNFRHVPNENRRKLDDKSEPMVFVGYHPTGSYSLYNPTTKKIAYKRDVIIEEIIVAGMIELPHVTQQLGCLLLWKIIL